MLCLIPEIVYKCIVAKIATACHTQRKHVNVSMHQNYYLVVFCVLFMQDTAVCLHHCVTVFFNMC